MSALPAQIEVEQTARTARQHQNERAGELLAELAGLPDDASQHSRAREELVAMHLPLAEHLARRFINRGEPLDDLVQVATIGLIKAIDGFDPGRGVQFASYAIPTMVGEIKRHFRDKGWILRVPRRLKEMKLDVSKATAALTQDLGRTPTHADVASYLRVDEAEIRECAVSSQAYSAMSLSAPAGGQDQDSTLADLIGGPDEALSTVEDRESLRPLIDQLPPRQRRIIAMRFYGNMTQSQIANQIGISQMHVSRLLTRSLAQLRKGMLAEV
ncbi:N/A [soil metagenome]